METVLSTLMVATALISGVVVGVYEFRYHLASLVAVFSVFIRALGGELSFKMTD